MREKVSVVIPAQDEELSIGKVVSGLRDLRHNDNSPVIDEIIVCDNNSGDHTAELAEKEGARVVPESSQGYGQACLTALANVSQDTDIIIFCDGDYSFLAKESLLLLKEIHGGADLVIGTRASELTELGSLTLPQRFGNWLACIFIRFIWQKTVTDLGPYRAIRKHSLDRLNMQNPTFGWTIEMQIKAIQKGMVTVEVPVTNKKRLGVSKISGTLKGTIGAGIGILSMIFKLWWQQRRIQHQSENAISNIV